MGDRRWKIHGRRIRVLHGDCMRCIKSLPDCSIDAIVTDPPYALTGIGAPFGFDKRPKSMEKKAQRGYQGMKWDVGDVAFNVVLWKEALRVLKPGGHLLAFSGSRTYHKLASSIENAGFDVRDQIKYEHDEADEMLDFVASLSHEQRAQWLKLYGERGAGQLSWNYISGMPKGINISLAVENILFKRWLDTRPNILAKLSAIEDAEARDEATYQIRKKAGLARERGARLNNIVFHKTTQGHRTGPGGYALGPPVTKLGRKWDGFSTAFKPAWEPIAVARKPISESTVTRNVLRWGTGALNINGTRVPLTAIEAEKYAAAGKSVKDRWPPNIMHDGSDVVTNTYPLVHDESAARFFFSAKAGPHEKISDHPTQKTIRLMQYLVRAVMPPGGVVLDMFAGTGTTGFAAAIEGHDVVLIEREADYIKDIVGRFKLFHKMSDAIIERERNLHTRFSAERTRPPGMTGPQLKNRPEFQGRRLFGSQFT